MNKKLLIFNTAIFAMTALIASVVNLIFDQQGDRVSFFVLFTFFAITIFGFWYVHVVEEIPSQKSIVYLIPFISLVVGSILGLMMYPGLILEITSYQYPLGTGEKGDMWFMYSGLLLIGGMFGIMTGCLDVDTDDETTVLRET